jgi:AcrR family transcriptional regulator
MENYLKDATSTREKILHATLKIIGKEGFQNITIKKIADLAEVNIAAVNYHFGSKTNVISEAIKVLNGKLMKCFCVLQNKEIPPVERLRSFLLSYTESALEYPDVFRNFIDSAINNNAISSSYIEFLKKDGIGKIISVLKEAGVAEDGETLAMKMVQMISALEFPILLSKQVKFLAGIDYNENDVKEKYVELILKSLLS